MSRFDLRTKRRITRTFERSKTHTGYGYFAKTTVSEKHFILRKENNKIIKGNMKKMKYKDV